MHNSAGAWENIDPTLVQNADGTISTTATPNPLTFSGGGTGPVITAGDGAGHTMALSLPIALPAPTVSGASATYASVYPGIDLTVNAQPSGAFSEVFEVHTAAADAQAQNLHFTTTLTGLTLQQNTDGSLNAVDAAGDTVLSAPPAAMWDSATGATPATSPSVDFETVTNPDSSAAGPGLGAHTGALPVTDSGSTMTLTGNPSQLDTTTPTYPLYEDPTWVEPYQSGGMQHYAEMEAGCPSFTTFDNVSQPGVGNVTTNTSCPGAYETYYQIDTSNVIDPSYDIKSATLKINELYSSLNSCNEGSETITIYTTSPITSGVNWSDKPALGQNITHKSIESVGNAAGTMCSGNSVAGDFDVSSGIAQVRAANSGKGVNNWTFALVGNETNGSNSLERFNNNPSIYTVYDIPPNTPTNLAASPAPVNSNGAVNQDCGGSTVGYLGITNLGGQHIATLSATLTSAIAAAQMQGVFTLHDDTTNANIATLTSSGYVTTGATVSVQTPALTDGHQYGWVLKAYDQYDWSPQTAMCHFIVDQTPPNNPTVTSPATDFPPLGSATPTTKRYGQTGNNSGTISFSSTDPNPNSGTGSGLKGFYYSLNEPATPSSSYIAAGTGGTASVTITPTHWGTSTLYVEAVDNAGNYSAQTQYSFYLPWYPGAAVTAGDINGDGIPDLVTTSGSGLVEYPGNSDTSAAPLPLSTSTESPDGTAWTNFQFSHDGAHNGPADDLWAFNTTTHELYLYKNNGSTTGNNFNNTGQITGPITKGEVATDAENDSDAGNSTGSTACYNTTTYASACTSYYNADWSKTSQVIASPDLYALSPDKSTLDGSGVSANAPGLLAVEQNGTLWYYQGQSTLDYIGTAVELSPSDWSSYTVMSPVTVNGQLVMWARNSAGAIYQYPVDYGTDGYPYLGTGTQLTVPGAPDLTPTAYPAVYAQVLHATSTTTYPDLITQNADGQVMDYPGAAANPQGAATFTSPQPLGQPSDTLAAAYQDSAGNLHTYSVAGTASPGIAVSTGSSPSTVALPSGGHATAFRSTDSNGDLEIYNSATGVTTNTTEGVHSGTSPSIAVSATGVIQVAFQANNGYLYIYNASTEATTNTAQGMYSGTSPSLAATPAGAFKAVFEANTTDFFLYDVNANKTTDAKLGMQAGTNPAIAAAGDGDFAAVFQANTGDLWTYDPATGWGTGTTKGMMKTSSPAIAANSSGTFRVAFQANVGDLYLWDYALTGSLYAGTTIAMNNTSNPSVAAEPDGTFRVAIQTSTGILYIYNPTTSTGIDTGQAINSTTSPSIN